MNTHLDEWLDAYLDGELSTPLRKQADQHLESCEACRRQLEQRRSLAALLQEVPPAHDLKPEARFTAEVGLQLPTAARKVPGRSGLQKLAWALVPAGLLLAMVFVQVVLIVSTFLEFIPGASKALFSGASFMAEVPSLPSPLSGILAFYSPVNAIGWNGWMGWAVMGVMGLLYVVWLVAWWARTQAGTLELQ